MSKIAFIISSLRKGGAERVVTELSNYFLRSSLLEVEIITIEEARNSFILDSNVHLFSLNCLNDKGTIRNMVKRIFKLRNHLKVSKPDLVISFMTVTNIESIIVSKILLNIPIVISERSHPFYSADGLLKRVMRRLLYPFANTLVCQTKGSSQYYSYLKSRIIISNPVKSSIVNYNLDRKNIILAVGSLRHEKGFDLLIKSFKEFSLESDLDDWKLEIVGEGKERANLESLIKKYELNTRVSLLGQRDNVDLYYKRSKIFVLSSRLEGMPNVLLEAMNSELACIAFNCNFGPKEMLVQNSGVLVQKENVKMLGDSMISLARSNSLRASYGVNAKLVMKSYSIECIGNIWLDHIKKIISK